MNEDMLVTFRTLSGEWADQARVEAKAAIEAFNAGAGDATEAARRLVLMVDQIHANCARTLDGLRAALTNNSLAAEPDDLGPARCPAGHQPRRSRAGAFRLQALTPLSAKCFVPLCYPHR